MLGYPKPKPWPTPAEVELIFSVLEQMTPIERRELVAILDRQISQNQQFPKDG